MAITLSPMHVRRYWIAAFHARLSADGSALWMGEQFAPPLPVTVFVTHDQGSFHDAGV
jgi:hypothetical protein